MPRATPLPPAQRRAALIEATEPLLEHFGRDVSTKRIAEAAGVAEGTIFRVFPTKDALIDAVCDQVLDVDRACAEIRAIDRSADLETRLVAAVSIMQRRLRRIFTLFHALRADRRKSFGPGGHRNRYVDPELLSRALAELLEPDSDQLRMSVPEAADALRVMTLALTHPLLGDHRAHEPQQIVDLVLHGVARAAPCPSSPTSSTDRTHSTGTSAC